VERQTRGLLHFHTVRASALLDNVAASLFRSQESQEICVIEQHLADDPVSFGILTMLSAQDASEMFYFENKSLLEAVVEFGQRRSG